MAIVLIILGVLAWIVDVNSWFIVPEIVYKGLIVGGAAWLVFALLFNVFVTHNITKKF